MADAQNCPPSADLPSPSKKKRRRSWFTPGRTTMKALEIKREKGSDSEMETENDVMILSHFTKTPRIDFGKTRPGKTITRTLILRNPHDYEQEVAVEKFPYKKDFFLDFTTFTVGPEREVHLEITWTPSKELTCREMVLFRINDVYRLQAYVFGSAVEPPKPKKRRGMRPTAAKSVATTTRGRVVPGKGAGEKKQVLRNVQNIISSRSELTETPKRRTDSRQSEGRRLKPSVRDLKDSFIEQSDLIEGVQNENSYEKSVEELGDVSHSVDGPDVDNVSVNDTRESFVPVTLGTVPANDEIGLGRATFAVVQPLDSADVENVSVNDTRESFVPVTLGTVPANDEIGLGRETFAVVQPLSKVEESECEVDKNSGLEAPGKYLPAGRETFAVVQPISEIEKVVHQIVPCPEPKIKIPRIEVENLPFCSEQTPRKTHEVRAPPTPRSMRRSLTYTKTLQLTISPKQLDMESCSESNAPTSEVTLTDSCAGTGENQDLAEDEVPVFYDERPRLFPKVFALADEVPVTPNSFLKETEEIRRSSLEPSTTGEVPSPATFVCPFIPHNVMVKQLETVKTNLHGRLSGQFPSSPPHSPNSPRKTYALGVNMPMQSPPRACMPRLGLYEDRKCFDSSTVTKMSKFAPSRKTKADSVPDQGHVSKLFCPSPTTERREVFISPSNLTAASLEIPHTPDLLIRRMTVTKDKPTVLKPDGTTSCKRLFPKVQRRDSSPPSELDESIMAESISDPSRLSISPTSTTAPPEPPGLVRVKKPEPRPIAKVSKSLRAVQPKVPSKVESRKLQVPVERMRTRQSSTKSQPAPQPGRTSAKAVPSRKPASQKSPGKRNCSPLSRTEPALKKIKKELTEAPAEPSPNGKRLTRTEQLRIAASNKKKTVPAPEKPKTRARVLPKGVAQARLVLNKKSTTVLPKHPMPFAAKNMYYDERWIEKQERGFTRWLNFILTPQEDNAAEVTRQKVDASKVCLDSQKHNDKLAPTKEVLSFRAYTARRNLNNLRRAACRLFQSDTIVTVIQKVECEIDSGRLSVRKDRKLRADLGIKQRILDMVLSYNPLWLRIGLETVYGEILPINATTDVVGLSRFVLTRMLENPDIANEFAHQSVPHLFREGYEGMLAKFTLKKFLILVFFLDQAKQKRLINHNPCLFCKDADFKTSRDLLIQFNKDYLSGEGDLTKHLSYMKYTVSHVQTALEEYDFAVTNLAMDLRDGLRLTRVVEMLTQKWNLSQSLRAPAISRLQKVHNVEVAFKELTSRGMELEGLRGGQVTPKDVVEGHREKTLGVLWRIIFKFQVDLLIDEKKLREEIAFLQNNLILQRDLAKVGVMEAPENLGLPRDKEAMEPEVYFRSERLSLLLKWCQSVCAYYGVKVENFTVSFSDGRALCYIVHHYHPSMIRPGDIRHKTSLTFDQREDKEESDDESFDANAWSGTFSPHTGKPVVYTELLANEKENFKLLYDKVSELGGVPIMVKSSDMSNTIPDEKVVITYVSYLCARLLDIREETRAARKIQAAWRKYWLTRKIQHNQVKLQAIQTIQRAWKLYYARKRAMKERAAVIRLQAAWRGHSIRKLIAEQKRQALVAKQEKAASCIQYYFRAYMAKKRMQRLEAATVLLQAVWRGHLVRRSILRRHHAATLIQQSYRGWCAMVQERKDFLQKREAAVIIQRAVRLIWSQRLAYQNRAATLIQAEWRRYSAVLTYRRKKAAGLKLQALVRRNLARKKFLTMKSATLVIQERYCAMKATKVVREEFLAMRGAAILIQTEVRKWLLMLKERRFSAAQVIQAAYRMHRERTNYLKLKQAAVRIQTAFRKFIAVREYKRMQWAVFVIQERYWTRTLQKQCRLEFLEKRQAALRVQAAYRGYKVRKAYRKLRAAAVTVQAIWKQKLARSRFLRMKQAVKVIETRYKAFQLGQQEWCSFNIQKGAVITIQAAWRCHVINREYRKIRTSAITIQSYARMQKAQSDYLQKRAACIRIQQSYRAFVAMRASQARYLAVRKATRLIQACVRSWLCQGDLNKMKQAAVTVQKLVRAKQAKERYLKLRNATIVIQRHFRAKRLAQEQKHTYLILRESTIKIQAALRSYLARKEFVKKKNACIKIQSHVRKFLQQRRYMQLKSAAVLIQNKFRARRLSQQEVEEYQAMRRAAIQVQSVFRGFRVRQQLNAEKISAMKIQAQWRGYITRKQFLALKRATVVMQRNARRSLLMKRQRKEYLAIKSSAIVIQACYRGYRVRQELQAQHLAAAKIQASFRCYRSKTSYFRAKHAAITLQRRYRALKTMKIQRAEFLALKDTVVKVQALLRGNLVRKELKVKLRASTTIQAAYRMHKARKSYRRMKRGAETIQAYFRGHQMMLKERNRFERMKRAALTIQACSRGFLVRRHFAKSNKAAVVIQAQWRMYLERSRFLKMRFAVLTIQQRYRTHRITRKMSTDFAEVRAAAILIQAAYRGYAARKSLAHLKAQVLKIQALYRMRRAGCAYKKMRNAALIVQARFRGYLATKQQREEFDRARHAAVVIQSWMRGYVVRKQVRTLGTSAVVIQKWVRMFLQGKKYLRLHLATVMIQRTIRAHFLMKKEMTEYREMRQAAVKIQSHFRGHCVRKSVRKQQHAATVVQSAYRAYVARKRYLQVREAVSTIQKRFRGYCLMKEKRYNYQVMVGATMTIQAFTRGFLIRKYLRTISRAATVIQAGVRMWQARRKYLNLRSSTLVLQRRVRCCFLMRKEREAFLVRRKATCRIQAFFRGYSQRMTYQRLRAAALKIQVTLRMRWERTQYLKLRNAALCLQRCYRKQTLKKKYVEDYRRIRSAAIRIQAAYRGYVARLACRRERAAVVVQAYWRMYRRRVEYSRWRAATVRIQSTWRMFTCRCAYRRSEHAIRVIQCRWRATLLARSIQQDFLIQIGAAITIQAAVRTFLTRKRYLKTRDLIIRMQQYCRVRQMRREFVRTRQRVIFLQRKRRALVMTRTQRQNFLEKKNAVLQIQAHWRGRQARKFVRRVQAAITIQSAFRMHRERTSFQRQLHLIRRVQAVVRMQRQRREYLRLLKAASLLQVRFRAFLKGCETKRSFARRRRQIILVQSLVRGHLARKRLKKVRAAIKIQSAFRGFLQRRAYLRRRGAVVHIQALVRGHQARTKVKVLKAKIEAATRIQRAFRRNQEQKKVKRRQQYLVRYSQVVRRHLSVICIQRLFRQYQTLKQAREKIQSVLIIQAWMRAKLERLHFIKKRKAAVKIQSAVRRWLDQRSEAVTKIQALFRGWRERKRAGAVNNAACIIQAWWRGHKQRVSIKNTKIKQVRQRIAAANREATEDKKLCNRTSSALEYLLTCRQLAAILEALMHLEVATRLSPRCCERMVEDNAVPVLYTLIEGCNRSVPHMELIKYTFDILMNLAKYDKTREAVWMNGAMDLILHQIQIFLGKGAVFTKACTLLGILVQDRHRREELTSCETFVGKIQSIYSITARKHKMKERQQIIKNKMSTSMNFPPNSTNKKPKIMSPFWVLRKDKLKEIKEPMEAINFVMHSLQLVPK